MKATQPGWSLTTIFNTRCLCCLTVRREFPILSVSTALYLIGIPAIGYLTEEFFIISYLHSMGRVWDCGRVKFMVRDGDTSC